MGILTVSGPPLHLKGTLASTVAQHDPDKARPTTHQVDLPQHASHA